MYSSSSSGIGNGGSNSSGILEQVVHGLPKGLQISESICTEAHINTLLKCVQSCLKEVREKFSSSSSSSIEYGLMSDVSYTSMASLFP
jgi:hypothetical protein